MDIMRAEQSRDALGDLETLEDAAAEAAASAAAAEADLADAEQRATSAQTALETAQRAHADVKSPADALDAQIRTLDAEIKGLERLLRRADGPARTPVMAQIKAEDALSRALAAALGDDLDAPVEDDAPEHWTLHGATATAALPDDARNLWDMVDAPKALAPRLTQCGLVDQTAGPELQPQLRPGQRLVSKEGDLWRWGRICQHGGRAHAGGGKAGAARAIGRIARGCAIRRRRASICTRRRSRG